MGVGVLNYASRQVWDSVRLKARDKVRLCVDVVVGRLSERQPRQGSAGTLGSLRFSTPQISVGIGTLYNV